MAINNLYKQFAAMVLVFCFSACSLNNDEPVKDSKTNDERSAVTEKDLNNKTESFDNNAVSKALSNEQINSKKEKAYELGGNSIIKAIIHKNKGESELFFLNIHDNENTSVDATIEHIKRFGGTFVELRHTGERLIKFVAKGKEYKFDPNRMFSDRGIEKDLIKYNGKTNDISVAKTIVKGFSSKLVEDFIKPNNNLIVTVHNNTDNGGLTINTYRPDTLETADVYVAKDEDVDNFFIVTEKKHFDALANGEFNVVLQSNEFIRANRSIDDGSLSIYCGFEAIPYINVETQTGNLGRQKEMLEALTKALSKN